MDRCIRSLTVFVLALVAFGASAQHDPQFTQYMFQRLNYNPGYAGLNDDYICAGLLFRTQWAGFSDNEGANNPTTQAFNMHTSLRNPFVQGVGLTVVNDNIGFINTISVGGNAAHHREFSFGTLSLGLGLGIMQSSLNGDWYPPDRGASDPFIPEGDVSNTALDLNLGAFFKAQDYYVGISALHLTEGQTGWGEDNTFKRHYYLTAGYFYELNPNIELQPSVLVKNDGVRTSFDITALANYQQKFWGGISYRDADAFNLIFGLKVLDQLRIGYSYDLPYNGGEIKQAGSHEVTIGYCFRLQTDPVPPGQERIIWTPRYLGSKED